MWVGGVTVELAVVLLKGVKQALWDNVELVEGSWQGWASINIPIGASITNHHTLEVDLLRLGLDVTVVGEDLP